MLICIVISNVPVIMLILVPMLTHIVISNIQIIMLTLVPMLTYIVIRNISVIMLILVPILNYILISNTHVMLILVPTFIYFLISNLLLPLLLVINLPQRVASVLNTQVYFVIIRSIQIQILSIHIFLSRNFPSVNVLINHVKERQRDQFYKNGIVIFPHHQRVKRMLFLKKTFN